MIHWSKMILGAFNYSSEKLYIPIYIQFLSQSLLITNDSKPQYVTKWSKTICFLWSGLRIKDPSYSMFSVALPHRVKNLKIIQVHV